MWYPGRKAIRIRIRKSKFQGQAVQSSPTVIRINLFRLPLHIPHLWTTWCHKAVACVYVGVFIYLFTYLFIYLLMYLFTYLLIYWLIYLFTYLLIDLFIYLFIDWFIYLLIYLLIDLFN